FGTDSYWISGTFCAVAFCCASAGAAHTRSATADRDAIEPFTGIMGTSQRSSIKRSLLLSEYRVDSRPRARPVQRGIRGWRRRALSIIVSMVSIDGVLGPAGGIAT